MVPLSVPASVVVPVGTTAPGTGPELLLEVAEIVVNLTLLVLPPPPSRLLALVLVVNLLVPAAPTFTLLHSLTLLPGPALVALVTPRPVDVEAVGAGPVVRAEDGRLAAVPAADALHPLRARRPLGPASVALTAVREVDVAAARVRASPVAVAELLRLRVRGRGFITRGGVVPAGSRRSASIALAAKGKVGVPARGVGARPVPVARRLRLRLGAPHSCRCVSSSSYRDVAGCCGRRWIRRWVRVTRVGVASEGIGVVARGEVEAVAAALTLREGYRQRGPHELGVVEPRHRRFRRVRVRVGHRGVALGKAGVAIAVQPDLVASPLLVLLQRADGAEVRGDVLLGDDVGEARDVHRVVALRGDHGDTRCARRPCALTHCGS